MLYARIIRSLGKMIKAILYDLDGVLVDATEWHYESLNAALNEVLAQQPKSRSGEKRKVAVDKFPEVTPEPQSVEAAGNDIAKPEHPARDKAHRARKRLSNISVASP